MMLQIKYFPDKEKKKFKKIIDKMIKTRQNYNELLKDATNKLKETKRLRKSTKSKSQGKLKSGDDLYIQMIDEEEDLTDEHSYTISAYSSRHMSRNQSFGSKNFL